MPPNHLLFDRMFRSSDTRPLLEDDNDLNLATLIYNLASREIGLDAEDDDADSVLSFEVKAETTRSNLKHVTDLFKKTNKARRRFLTAFPAWSILRRKNIDELKKIVQAILKDRFNGNISKLVGGCTGVLGGAALIASLLFPPAAPAIIPMAIAGGVASGLGGGVVFGTAVTEIVLSKKNMDKAKAVIENDRECFSSLKHWFEHTRELMDAIDELVGFELMKKMSDDVKKFVEETKEKTNELKGGSYNQNFRELVDKCIKGMCSSGRIQANFGVQLAPVVVTFVFVVCLMSQRNRFLFECLVITHRLGMGLLSFLDVSVELGRLVAALATRGGLAAAEVIPRAGARAAALGVFAGIGVALDLANVIVASIDIHKGSLSKEAMMIAEVADKLQEEFRFLEEVHSEILYDLMR